MSEDKQTKESYNGRMMFFDEKELVKPSRFPLLEVARARRLTKSHVPSEDVEKSTEQAEAELKRLEEEQD